MTELFGHCARSHGRRSARTAGAAIGAVIATALFATEPAADKPEFITESEMALIPAYCRDANTFGYGGTADSMSPNAPKWVAMMGKGFWAIHHYCWALINLRRAQGPLVSPMVKQNAREQGIRDLMYVVEHSPSDFILLPEIFTKMGQVQLELKRPLEAGVSFGRARAQKPDYWPAYFHWAVHLQNTGQKGKARQFVETGLAYSPDSAPLRKLLVELGGDPKTVMPKPVPTDSKVDPAAPPDVAAPPDKPPAKTSTAN
jgi:hypothetical protein